MSSVCIEEEGKEFRTTEHTTVILTDNNCIWHGDNIYFTETGWKNYCEKKDSLSHRIDEMRNI